MKKKLLLVLVALIFTMSAMANCFAISSNTDNNSLQPIDRQAIRQKLFEEQELFKNDSKNSKMFTSLLLNKNSSTQNKKSVVKSSVNAVFATTSVKSDATKTVARNEKSIVLIKTYDKNGELFGLGSGFIVSEDGKIVTNYHVVRTARDYSVGDTDVLTNLSRIEIIGSNGLVYSVTGILAADKNKDIAVIRFDNIDNLPYVNLADSDSTEICDDVVAIGCPLGIRGTISTGIISKKMDFMDYVKEVYGEEFAYYFKDAPKYIQTTAPISPGSSGGALFNMNGEVIGVTAASMFFGQNINFAIPSNVVKEILDNISTSTDKINYDRLSTRLSNIASNYSVNGETVYLDSVTAVPNYLDNNSIALQLNLNEDSFKQYMILQSKDFGTKVREDMESWMKLLTTSIIPFCNDKSVVGSMHFKGKITDINKDLFYKYGIDVQNDESSDSCCWWWIDTSYLVDFDLLYFSNVDCQMNYQWWSDCCWFWWFW